MHRPNRPSACDMLPGKKKWHHMDLTKQAGTSLPLQMDVFPSMDFFFFPDGADT